ncbi:helix-turn-helix domain-containing protein [Ligilactobacillus sp. LYQ135]
MDLSKKILKLRINAKLSQTDAAKGIGISRQLLNQYEHGKVFPRRNNLQKISDFYNVPISELLSESNSKKELPDNAVPLATWIKVPVLGEIACGQPLLAEQNIETYQSIPANMLSKNLTGVFGLYCHGDSMSPNIEDGDLVIIHKQSFVEDGEVAAILINDEATLKRIKHVGSQILLMPDNSDYDPIILNQQDDNRILGKVILKISKSI